jgi:ABC-type transport system substrate-binding protein
MWWTWTWRRGARRWGSEAMNRFANSLAAVTLAAALAVPAHAAPAGPPDTSPKVLRYAFPIAETGFDPVRVNDIYSRIITGHIFEGLYHYDHLARPPKIDPLTAAGMPEVSADYRVWTIKLRPGIYFQSDPAFGGRQRELTAQDYVYAFKRFADPANKSPNWSYVESQHIAGLAALRQQALDAKRPLDYDRPIDGLQALDRYTVRFTLDKPSPTFLEVLAQGEVVGAVAREVVERYGESIAAHPVGTGPFKLVQWRRSSQIALERNREYRERFYDADPAPDDAEGQALLAMFKGRRLPMLDRIEVAIIEEQQPRWLSFLNGEYNFVDRVPNEFINIAAPHGKLAPNLSLRGIKLHRNLAADSTLSWFNMDDPVVGGYTPDKVALRRAISLGIDVQREIRLVRRGQAIPAQSPLVPHTTGYDPAFKSENSEYDPARAKALLDVYGYVDRDGDGWREQPDGSPLVLRVATQPSQLDRQFDELWKRNMDAIGLRVTFKAAKWPENMKAARAGALMIWSLGSTAAGLDGQTALARSYGPESGGQNLARFKLPAFDAIYERMQVIPDGPERDALFRRAKEIVAAYAAYKVHVHRIYSDMASPEVIGYRRPVLWQDWWQYVDIDRSRQRAR